VLERSESKDKRRGTEAFETAAGCPAGVSLRGAGESTADLPSLRTVKYRGAGAAANFKRDTNCVAVGCIILACTVITMRLRTVFDHLAYQII
jgi:hypothetical protein